MTLHINDYQNSYDLWAYPDDVKLNKKGIVMASSLTDDVVSKLQKGAKVLLTPDSTDLCVGGLFQTDYWNYRMFKTISENNKKPVSPGTLGLLCDPSHPLFSDSCCEGGTWQDALKRGARLGVIAGSDSHDGSGGLRFTSSGKNTHCFIPASQISHGTGSFPHLC